MWMGSTISELIVHSIYVKRSASLTINAYLFCQDISLQHLSPFDRLNNSLNNKLGGGGGGVQIIVNSHWGYF